MLDHHCASAPGVYTEQVGAAATGRGASFTTLTFSRSWCFKIIMFVRQRYSYYYDLTLQWFPLLLFDFSSYLQLKGKFFQKNRHSAAQIWLWCFHQPVRLLFVNILIITELAIPLGLYHHIKKLFMGNCSVFSSSICRLLLQLIVHSVKTADCCMSQQELNPSDCFFFWQNNGPRNNIHTTLTYLVWKRQLRIWNANGNKMPETISSTANYISHQTTPTYNQFTGK